MQIERIRARNLGPFAEVDLDLSELGDAAIVAIVGDNGAGKSTLLELATGGALYRECATRGSLAGLATTRDARLEVDVVTDRRWRCTHRVDAVSGKGESVAVGDDGEGSLSGKVRDYDAWARTHLPTPEVLYSSTVLVQRGRSFLDLSVAERKAVILRVLGVEHLEELAGQARIRARSTQAAADVASARLADARREPSAASRAAECGDAEAQVELRQRALDDARERLARARAEAERVTADRARIAANDAKRADLERRHAEVARDLADVKARLANNRGVIERREEIESAVARHIELGAELDAARAESARFTSEVRRLSHEVEHWHSERERCHREHATVGDREGRLLSALAQELAIMAAVEALPRLAEEARVALSELDEARAALERVSDERAAGSEERIGALREGLREIAECEDGGEVSWRQVTAVQTLTDDDMAVARATELPGRLAAAKEAVARAGVVDRDAQDRLRQARELAALRGRIEADRQALAEARESMERISERGTEAAAREATAAAALVTTRRMAAETTERVSQLMAAIEELRPVWSLADRLVSATARLEELRPRVSQLETEELALLAELIYLSTDAHEAPPLAINLDAVEHMERRTAQDLADAQSRAAVARANWDRAKASDARAAELETELTGLLSTVSDWTRIGADLGRDGLQAALVDAAGPELTAIANELLHECVGSRWTVSVETQRLASDGRRMLEGCEVRVLDTERGRDAAAESLSGGEAVLVGEAIALALSVMACRRAGMVRPTLVRDESGAALSPGNGEAYVAMLRRAAGIVGADRVLLVSHSPEVQALADARIVVANGGATR